MKIKMILTTTILTIALLIVSVSVALAVPPLPSSFYGTAKYSGANVPLGSVVSARINGVQYAQTTVQVYNGDTVYSLDVPGDDDSTTGVKEGGVPGDTVVFFINGIEADETASWMSGTNVQHNLTAEGLIHLFIPLLMQK